MLGWEVGNSKEGNAMSKEVEQKAKEIRYTQGNVSLVSSLKGKTNK